MQIHKQILSKQLTALMCSLLLLCGGAPTGAQAQETEQAAAATADEPVPKISNDELDSLVAPIALYQDPLLAQVLAASTYPLEIVQLQQFLLKHQDLKDKALADAVMKQNWDPSVQSMAALPDVVKRLADDISWTTDLGNAVLAQQSDVMEAVQRMRAKAQGNGNLKSSEQIKVETKVVESKTVIVIEQSKPDVVYVPTYTPAVVYGPPVYPYPPIAYPPPGYYAAGVAISFGVGMAIGAAWGNGGGWCCNSGWGGNNTININNNNNFVNNSNRQNINNSGNRNGNNNWQHNAQHRGGAPYSNKATANKYGGTARGDSMASRQANARQNQAQRGGGGRQQAGNMDRGGGRAQAGSADRGGRAQAGNMDRGGGRSQPGAANRGGGGGGGGGDRVGTRNVSSGSGGSSKGGGLGGGGASRPSGASARASSSRGASSMGGSRGGGRRR